MTSMLSDLLCSQLHSKGRRGAVCTAWLGLTWNGQRELHWVQSERCCGKPAWHATAKEHVSHVSGIRRAAPSVRMSCGRERGSRGPTSMAKDARPLPHCSRSEGLGLGPGLGKLISFPALHPQTAGAHREAPADRV